MTLSPEPLNSKEWHDVIIGDMDASEAASAMRTGYMSLWYKPVLDMTVPGDTVLETGSGTGQLCGALASKGRKPVLLDLSLDNLKFSEKAFDIAGLRGAFVQADILRFMPFSDSSIDCIFSHGVLEHFTEEEIQSIVNESARVARKAVISVVPNAASIAYRIGKRYQESTGKWQYGKENPKHSFRGQFVRSGLKNVKEYSVDPRHAFEFLTMLKGGAAHPVMKLLNRIPVWLLDALNQGWLLVTIGEK
jgi:ubiquinone/menaquinone biosynthesis C-methylase UbiE